MRRPPHAPCPVCAGPLGRVTRTARYCMPCFRVAHPIASMAMALVNRAVRRGELAHPSTLQCADCARQAFGYDHRDYTQPLVVEPICRKCNYRRSSAYPLVPGAIAHFDVTAGAGAG